MNNSEQHKLLLFFLTQSYDLLSSKKTLKERLFDLFNKVSEHIPFSHIKIELFDNHQEFNISVSSSKKRLHDDDLVKLKFNLIYQDHQLGTVFLFISNSYHLNSMQQLLMELLVKQLSTILFIEYELNDNQYLSLIKERSAMARELHDSIAQSLSYLKINLSCLGLQKDIHTPETLELLDNMRKEVNTAYAQLRDLITSFKFNIDQPYLLTSIENLISEFNQKLKLTIELDYQLPVMTKNNAQFIHLLQIIREALNNIFKHAKATKVKISLTKLQNDIIEVIIQDNGIGLQHDWKKKEHYGLGIMQNRVDYLQGFFYIESELQQGVTIRINFKMKGVESAKHKDHPIDY